MKVHIDTLLSKVIEWPNSRRFWSRIVVANVKVDNVLRIDAHYANDKGVRWMEDVCGHATITMPNVMVHVHSVKQLSAVTRVKASRHLAALSRLLVQTNDSVVVAEEGEIEVRARKK